MRKTIVRIGMAILICSLILAGCGSKKTPDAGQNSKTDPASGTALLLQTANQFKQALQQNDEAKIKQTGPKLEQIWSSFEDSVKPKYPDNYKEIEKYLDPAVAGSKSAPLNDKVLLKLDNSLIQAVEKLQQQMK